MAASSLPEGREVEGHPYYYYLTALLPYYLTTLLPYYLTILLPYYLTTLLLTTDARRAPAAEATKGCHAGGAPAHGPDTKGPAGHSLSRYGYACMAMRVWLCVYGYACMALLVWLCLYGYACMAILCMAILVLAIALARPCSRPPPPHCSAPHFLWV